MRHITPFLVAAAGLALALLPLSDAALVVAAGAIVIAGLIRPEACLFLLAFAVPFGSVRSISLGGFTVTAVEILSALLAASWLGRGVLRRSITIPRASPALPVLLWILAQVLSLFDALSFSLAAKELIKWSEILVVYVIATDILAAEPQRTPRILLLCLLAAALAEALLGVYQFIARAGPEWFLIGRFLRAYGTFDQPNPYAGYLNHALPLGYALLLALLQRAGSLRNALKSLPVPAVGGWLAIVGAALLMSLSRGAWLGLAVAVVAINMLWSRRSALAMLAGGGLLAALLILSSANLLPAALTGRFSTVSDYFRIFDARNVKVTDANFAIVERMAHWQAAWSMIHDRPWLGFGAGNYPAAYPTYSLAGWKEALGHAHNVPLNVWAETGIIGLAAYLAFLIAALWMCRRAAQAAAAAGDALGRALALGVLGVLLAHITHDMLDNLWVHSMGVQIALLLALAQSVSQKRRADPLHF